MVSSKVLREKIELAKKSVEGLDEPFKTESFRIVLDNLLEEKGQTEPSTKHTVERQTEETKAPEFDGDKYSHIAGMTSGQDQAVTILDWAFEKHPQSGLTPKEVSDILKEKFRVSLPPNAINVALGRVVGTMVSRRKEGKSYRYTITKKGQQYIQNWKPEQKNQ